MAINGKTAIGGMIIALLTASVIALPAMAAGMGIGLAPNSYDIKDALRGASYDVPLVITNMGETTTDFAIAAEGEASAWLSYDYKGETVEKVSVPGSSKATFEVKISIPVDAVNGKHQAIISVTSIPVQTTGGSSVAVGALSHLDIEVTGNQIIAATASGIKTEDVETGYPLKIEVFVQNTGNVEVNPIITANITSNGKAIDSVTKDDAKVGAGKGDFIIVEWDTTGNPVADYQAKVVVKVDGKDIASQDLSFKILPLGALTRSGELKSLELNDAPLVNLPSKMTATFVNTGQIDTRAKLTGEIYRDGQLIDTFTGEELLIAKGMEGQLTAYITVTDTGDYTIKGWVVYEGKETESKELDMTVTEPQTSSGIVAGVTPPPVTPAQNMPKATTGGGLAAVWYVVIGIAGAAVLAAA